MEKNQIEIVIKGWGHEKIIWNKEYCGKLLFFNKDKRCSFHKHLVKDEVFFLQSGRIHLRYGWSDNYEETEEVILEVGDSFHIPVGMRHQMTALETSELFEFSTHSEDSDSVRVIKGD